MKIKKTIKWMHTLRVPKDRVADVVRLLEAEKERVKGFYDGRIQALFHESCRPPALEIAGVLARPHSVVVLVSSDDCRGNVLTEALEHVIPADLGVGFPHWS